MSRFKRVWNVILGIITIVIAVLMQIFPELGFALMLTFISIRLLFSGIRKLIFYFSMAKHMVDGKPVLYQGIISLNFGIFTLTVSSIPVRLAMIYLLVTYLFSTVITMLAVLEEKKVGAGIWKARLFYAIFKIVLALAGFFSLNSLHMAMFIYGLGLVIGAAERILRAFRRTTVVSFVS